MTTENLTSYFDYCWKEHLRFKEIKDKITYFIGTLFITVLFGSGLLIYQTYAHIIADSKEQIEYRLVLDKLYTLQYLVMHLFFLLLYLYYTYNNVLEKIFLIETQCTQLKILQLNPIADNIMTPVSLFRKKYSSEKVKTLVFKVRRIKDFGNLVLICIYFLFSLIPLVFKKDFNLFNWNTEVNMKFYWIPIGLITLAFVALLTLISKYFIRRLKKEILEKWGFQNNELIQ
jgi:hypothetical protein